MKKGLLIIALAVIAAITPLLPLKTAVLSAPVSAAKTQISRVNVSTSFDAQTDSLNITFSNLKSVKSIVYELTYDHDGVQEGVVGGFTVSGQKKVVRSIFLGTCSSGGTCINHTNISNMNLKVVVTYNSGATQTTNYPISI